MTTSPNFITRSELYNRVWETPATILATQLGVAESRLRKLCERNHVPRPKGAYWTLLKWGKAPGRTPLPIVPPNLLAETQIRIDLPPTPIEEMSELLKDALVVPPHLTNPLPCITRTLQYLEAQEKGKEEVQPKDALHFQVSPQLRERALSIFDTLLKAIQLRGHILKFRDNYVYAVIDEEEIKIRVRETTAYEDKKRVWIGKLKIIVHEDYSQVVYMDSESSPLEEQLAKVIVAIEAESGKVKQLRKDRQARDEEIEREWNVDQEEQDEEQIDAFKELLDEASYFETATSIRNYVNAVIAQSNGSREKALVKWVQWALQQADEIDPSLIKLEELRGR